MEYPSPLNTHPNTQTFRKHPQSTHHEWNPCCFHTMHFFSPPELVVSISKLLIFLHPDVRIPWYCKINNYPPLSHPVYYYHIWTTMFQFLGIFTLSFPPDFNAPILTSPHFIWLFLKPFLSIRHTILRHSSQYILNPTLSCLLYSSCAKPLQPAAICHTDSAVLSDTKHAGTLSSFSTVFWKSLVLNACSWDDSR